MTWKRQKKIDEIADRFLRDMNGYSTPPIDVKKVINQRGIDLVEYDFGEDISGVFLDGEQKVTIGYNSNQGDELQRFGMTHSLGHYILGHQRNRVFVDTPKQYFTILMPDSRLSAAESHQESEANAFAAALLMPKGLVLKAVQQMDIDFKKDDVIARLAKLFNVDRQIMAFRFATLYSLW